MQKAQNPRRACRSLCPVNANSSRVCSELSRYSSVNSLMNSIRLALAKSARRRVPGFYEAHRPGRSESVVRGSSKGIGGGHGLTNLACLPFFLYRMLYGAWRARRCTRRRSGRGNGSAYRRGPCPGTGWGGPLFVHRTGNGLGTPNRNLPALAPPGFVALLEHANGHPSTIARRIRRTFVPYVCDKLFRQRTFLRES